ncbi:hypothetical protein PR202_ga18607 [Eleusine coracana subsp. coracana]|uniref:Uncharacterized protein n=1 Tax=Eleusine coracana subsp. coracana TaxID=191504 RepID=A0AAV5CT40_ELECO|nr:hypothetical protein PR202_ga18607 [Eleusine coracana subsp. coracana]
MAMERVLIDLRCDAGNDRTTQADTGKRAEDEGRYRRPGRRRRLQARRRRHHRTGRRWHSRPGRRRDKGALARLHRRRRGRRLARARAAGAAASRRYRPRVVARRSSAGGPQIRLRGSILGDPGPATFPAARGDRDGDWPAAGSGRRWRKGAETGPRVEERKWGKIEKRKNEKISVRPRFRRG